MRIAECHLESVSPYSQSKAHNEPSLDKEAADDKEKRTWRLRIHKDDAGSVIVPPMAIKNMLSEIAQFLAIQIPGKGKSTYTKHFVAGVLVPEPMVLDVKEAEVQGEWLYLPSDGKRGGGKRVWRCYPMIPKWKGVVTCYVLDDTVTEKVFEHHLQEAGRFIGIGRFRPRNNGYYGRFAVKKIVWREGI